MKNENKLSFGSKIIILDRAIGNILDLFSNTFLTAYFYKLTRRQYDLYFNLLHNCLDCRYNWSTISRKLYKKKKQSSII